MPAGKRGGFREGSGRKPDAGERRHLLPVPVTDAEHAELIDLAGDIPVSTWLRELGLRQRG